jgi:tetratricopeptide (TPR) repeat protein
MNGRLAGRLAGAVALVLTAALCFVVTWLGGSAAQSYRTDGFDLAESRYGTASRVMPFERWKAPFGEGTAILATGDPGRAEGVLTSALARTPAAKQCLVRINLSLAQELQGDAAAEAEDTERAVEEYEAALETLRDRDCPARDQVAAEAEERLERKLDRQAAESKSDDPDKPDPTPSPTPSATGSGSGSPSPSPTSSGGGGGSASPEPSPSGGPSTGGDPEQSKLDELLERNRIGRQERTENRESRAYRPPRGTRPIW